MMRACNVDLKLVVAGFSPRSADLKLENHP